MPMLLSRVGGESGGSLSDSRQPSTVTEAQFFCERCGDVAVLVRTPAFSYCCGCRQYLCAECRGDLELRCRVCSGAESRRQREIRGVTAARWALRDIDDAMTDLARVRHQILLGGSWGSGPGSARNEWYLADNRIQSSVQAAEHALNTTSRPHRAVASTMLHDLWLKRVRLQGFAIYSPSSAPATPSRTIDEQRRGDELAGTKTALSQRATAVLALLYALALVILAALAASRSSPAIGG